MKKPFLLGITLSPILFIFGYWAINQIDCTSASNSQSCETISVDDLIKYNFIPLSGEAKNINFNYENNPTAKDKTSSTNRTLSALAGKPIVLHFWAKWCPSCVREMPSMDKFYKKYKDKVHFIPIAVDGDSKTIKKFYKDQNYDHLPICLDINRESARSYGVSNLPTTVFIDEKGQLLGRVIGPISWNRGAGADMMKVLYKINN